jgi:hypothetical protein
MEGVMQVWLAAEVQLLSVSGFPSDIPIAANPLHREAISPVVPDLHRRPRAHRALPD